jgi:diguanylate cyclase (GGDEF)-like protein
MQRFITRLKPGDLLGEMGFIRSVPRSATVIATEPGELLQINWKMFKRLQWLYPPSAHKFFYNLITTLSDRLERSTNRLTEISRIDYLTGLMNKRGFVENLAREAHRAKRYESQLSVCLMRVDVEAANPELSFDDRDRIIKYLSGSFAGRVRKSDALGRVDTHMFGLILPHTSAEEAQQISERLWKPLEEPIDQAEATQVRLAVGLVEFSTEADDKESELLGRATEQLLRAMESGEYLTLVIPDDQLAADR